jgi:uncharacterized repeat protein (TIGR03803 family)
MFKKTTLFLLALLCALFASRLIHAQERLWVVDFYGSLSSMDTDGTDVFSRSHFGVFGEGVDDGFAIIKDVPGYNGHLIFSPQSGDGTDGNDYGTICRLGPNGIVKLYNLSYMEWDGGSGATATSTGVCIATADMTRGKWDGLKKIPYNGGSYVGIRKPNPDFSAEYQLINVRDTIYGVSRGDGNNEGFIYRVAPSEFVSGTYAVRIFQFTDSEQGVRPSGKLSYANGFLFGYTKLGGDHDKGVFFKVRTDGTGYKKLFDRYTESLAKPDINGKYQTLLDAVAEGYIPATDQEGNYYVYDVSGIYKVSDSGNLIARISTLNAEHIEVISPQFQHVVKISNIHNGATGLPSQFTVQLPDFSGAQLYQLEVSTTSDFSTGVQSLVNASVYFDLSLSAGVTYYSRARTDIWPYYGDVVSFTTANALTSTPTRFYINNDTHGSSIKRDGSDAHAFEETVIDDLLQLNNGDKIFMGDTNPEYDGDAALWKITPNGKEFLYQGYYGMESISPKYMVDGGDGYFYALQYSVLGSQVTGIRRFKIDGTATEVFPISSPNLLEHAQLTKTPQGIYGVARGSGINNGFIFKIKSDLSGLETIFTFTGNATGIRPYGKLLAGRDGFLYGTTRSGGINNVGVIFKVSAIGDQYTVLHHFAQLNGKNPETGLIQDSNGTLFGTTTFGGKNSYGVLYRVEEDGTDFQKLLDYFYTGGKNVTGSIDVDDSFIYATAGQGLFKIGKNGAGYQPFGIVAFSFQSLPNTASNILVNYPEDYTTPIGISDVATTTPINGARKYFLEVSMSPAFDINVTTFENDSAHFEISGLDYDKLYFARGRTNLSPAYGVTSTFRTGDKAFHVYVIDPADGTTEFGEASGSGMLQGWVTIAELPGAQHYHLQVSVYPEFYSWGTVDYNVESSSGNPQVLAQFIYSETRYYTRVRTDVSSNWGPVTSFITKSYDTFAKTTRTVEVYPNPSRGSFNLRSAADDVQTITISDATGNVLYRNDRVRNSESLQFGNDLQKGIYLMTIRRKNGLEVIRLVKE